MSHAAHSCCLVITEASHSSLCQLDIAFSSVEGQLVCFTNILRSSFHFLRCSLAPLTAFWACMRCVRAHKASVFVSVLWVASSQLHISCAHQLHRSVVLKHSVGATDNSAPTTTEGSYMVIFLVCYFFWFLSLCLPLSVWCDPSLSWWAASKIWNLTGVLLGVASLSLSAISSNKSGLCDWKKKQYERRWKAQTRWMREVTASYQSSTK